MESKARCPASRKNIKFRNQRAESRTEFCKVTWQKLYWTTRASGKYLFVLDEKDLKTNKNKIEN